MLKAPPLQTATSTIDTLCARLRSATLLEDRRAAILGLRSFAKQYPASVASGSVRELISTLKRDGLGAEGRNEEVGKGGDGAGDVDTIRLILETLLMLFNPDADSPEAGDEIAFFMADEFSNPAVGAPRSVRSIAASNGTKLRPATSESQRASKPS